MASDDAQLIVLRVVIRSPDVDTFVSKYSRFVKDDRIFIFTKAAQPPGTRVRFTLELADGPALIHGEGEVTRVRPDKGDPSKPPGMELRFQPLDVDSRQMIERMIKARSGVAPSTPPPADRPEVSGVEEINTKAQSDTSGVTDVRDVSRQVRDDVSTKIRTGDHPGMASTLPAGMTIPPNSLPPIPPTANPLPTIPPNSLPPIPPTANPLPTAPSMPIALHPGEDTDVVDSSRRIPTLDEAPPAFTATPTPLPAPLPGKALFTPAHGQPIPGFPPMTQPVLPALQATPPGGSSARDELSREVNTKVERPLERPTVERPVERAEETGAFMMPAGGEAPRFAESYVGSAPPPPGTPLPPANGTVPANPFSEVSDSAIEYFVEWSVLQSTEAHPKAHPSTSSFADVPMASAIEEPDREARARSLRLAAGLGIGLVLGVPVGAGLVWMFAMPVVPEPTRPIAEMKLPIKKSETAKAEPPAAAAAPAAKAEPPKETAKPEPKAEPPKAESPKAAAKPEAAAKSEPEKPPPDRPALERPVHAAQPGAAPPEGAPEAAELPPPPSLGGPHKSHLAVLRVKSSPSGAEVSIRGESRGATPLEIELAPNHRYDVVVTLPGKPPWKKRINLKPPTTEITAKF
jgi:uncharacterized protein (TIGR02266 family)